MVRPLVLTMILVSLPSAVFATPLPPPPPTPPPAELPPPPPPPPELAPAPPEAECYPACRSGYRCSAGRCTSDCNPGCGAGQQCEAGECTDASRLAPVEGPRVNDKGDRAPVGQHFELRRKKGLLITGTILFGVGYIFSAGPGLLGFLSSSLTTGGSDATYLVNLVPLAGPAARQIILMSRYGNRSPLLFYDLLFTGVVTALQITGLTLALVGIPRRQVLVDDEPGPQREERDSRLPPVQWSIAPFAPGAPLGVSLLVRN